VSAGIRFCRYCDRPIRSPQEAGTGVFAHYCNWCASCAQQRQKAAR
jgi:hypothetical protein